MPNGQRFTSDWPLSVKYPSDTLTAENAQRIIPVMLDNPATMWDLQAFMQSARQTTWWAELGAPPIHGLMFINEAKTTIQWWNLDTDSEYILFTAAANANLLKGTSISDLAFLDGCLYACADSAHGVTRIDFLRDSAHAWTTSGLLSTVNRINQRDVAQAWYVLDSSIALVGDTCYGFGVVRDPSLVDEFGRPKHWWAVATSATPNAQSAYNPVANAIYDFGTGYGDTPIGIVLSPSGVAVWTSVTVSGALSDYLIYRSSIFTIAADGQTGEAALHTNGNIPMTGSATLQAIAVMDDASANEPGMPIVAGGYDEGLILWHVGWDRAGGTSYPGHFIMLNADFSSPYCPNDATGTAPRAIWSGHSLTDPINGHVLTNNNAVTLNNGGPAGAYFDFVAASSMSLTLADHADFDGMSKLSFGCWFYREIDSGALEGLMSKYDIGDAGDRAWALWVGADDALANQVVTSSNKSIQSPASSIQLATWYYGVTTYDGATVRIYLNGVEVSSVAHTGSIAATTEQLTIGSASTSGSASNFFDGRIGGVFVAATAMNAREIEWEYQRGLRRLQSGIDANDALSNVDVKSIRVDQASKHFIVTTADDKVTILDQFGVPISQDTADAGTMRDACIWMPSGQDNPSYAYGSSTRVEFVQQTRRIFN